MPQQDLPYNVEDAQRLMDKGAITPQQFDIIKQLQPGASQNPEMLPASVEQPMQPVTLREDLPAAQTSLTGAVPTEPVRNGMYNPAVDKPQVTLASDIKPQQEIPQEAPNPFDQGYQLQQQGIYDAMKAGEKRAAEDAGYQKRIMAENQKRLAENAALQRQNEEYMRSKLDDLNGQLTKLESQKVDPNKYWANKTTGDKILAGIGMLLGSFGGKGNKAVEVVQDSIDRDIKLQQAQIEDQKGAIVAKKNLLGEMRQVFGDEVAAREATRIALLNNAAFQLQASAAKYGGEEAKSKALMALGQIENAKANAQAQFMQAMAKNAPLSRQALTNPELLTDEQRKRLVPGYGLATTEGNAKDMIQYVGDYNQAKSGIGRLLEIANTPMKSVSPSLRAEADTIASMLQGALRTQVLGPGSVQQAERDLLEKLIANPTAVFSVDSNVKKRLETLASTLDKNLEGKLKAGGVETPTERMANQERSAGIVRTSAKSK